MKDLICNTRDQLRPRGCSLSDNLEQATAEDVLAFAMSALAGDA